MFQARRTPRRAAIANDRSAPALLLDFDGVIVDSEGIQFRAVNQALEPFGVQISPEEWIERCVGHKARDFLPAILHDRIDADQLEALLVAKSEALQQLIRQTAPVARPGIPELIATARDRGFRRGIASATSQADIGYVVERLGLASQIEVIVSSDSVARPKPAPDVYLRAAELLGVAPLRCVVIEDTPTGLAAGRAAGMRCVAFPNQWTAALDFRDADFHVQSLDTAAIDNLLTSVDE